MRLGWPVPPRRGHADLFEAKHASDLGSPGLPQLVLARLIASGQLEQHIRAVRKRQRTGASPCSGRCARTCPRPASRASRRDFTC